MNCALISGNGADRSIGGLIERAKATVPPGYFGLAFNFHDGLGWYLLRAEPSGDEVLSIVRTDAESVGQCVVLVSRDGLLERTSPCVRRHDKLPCDP